MSISKKFLLEKMMLLESRFDYATFQINIDDPYIKHIKYLQKFIKKEDLDKFGIENKTHITVLYGVKRDMKSEVKDAFFNLKMKPFYVDVKELHVFKNETDALVLRCESEELIKLRQYFEERFPFKKTHRDYIPHITLAYLKSGKGESYKELLKDKFKNGKILVKYVYYSNKNGKTSRFRLG
jgi:2'-5' RNA ligase